jgi:hypothetical protein
MKAFGLAACMAKAGLLLPAQAPARLPCFSCVLADIGDEQSLTANLSTFSGHIKRCLWAARFWVILHGLCMLILIKTNEVGQIYGTQP